MKKLLLGLLVAAGLASPALATSYPAPTFSNVTITKNGIPFPSALTGTMVQAVQADGISARVEVDSFGAVSHFTGARTDGTGALPTQVLSGEEVTSFSGWAYNGVIRSGPIAAVRLYAAENIDGSHQGSKACLSTTPTGSVTMADGVCQQPSGGLTIGSPAGGDQGAGTINVSGSVLINGVSQLNQSPYNYLGGCLLSNDANTKAFDVQTCVARDSTNSADIINGAFVKNVNSGWVAGSSNASGCLDAGSIAVANTWYHIYAISKAAGANPDYLCSTNATSPTLPNTYALKRYIGSIKTDATPSILAFTQLGGDFLWSAPSLDVNVANVTQTPVLAALGGVPLGIKVVAKIRSRFINAGGATAILINSPDEAAITGATLAASSTSGYTLISAGSGAAGIGEAFIRTNTSQQIRTVTGSPSGTTYTVNTYGYFNPRGQ